MWTIHVVSTHVQGCVPYYTGVWTIVQRGVDHTSQGCGPYYTGVWTIVQRGVDYLQRGMDHMIPIVYKVSYMDQIIITLMAVTIPLHLLVTLPIITPTPHLHVVVRGRVGVVVGKGRSWCNSRQGGWLASQTQQQQGVVYAV